ncbi:hypothetical protein PCASD_19083 [Puccinia coronata f. sp. avenae]|uniref:Uncharacterized protein n=1 Tax=Puccinia coronata f. sp. avenae TaxID=200324 RepID=A0A2N5SY34_9BASI|nr:hypothetical protein PCASD_19083 [Puccinia coronata f. sp. avenae]
MAIGPGAHQAAQAQSGLGRVQAGTRQAAIPPGGSGGKAQAAEGSTFTTAFASFCVCRNPINLENSAPQTFTPADSATTVITAGINWSNTAARAVLKQPCSTGGRTDTVRPKREPTGRTDLSDRSRLVLCNRSQELIGQACPTRRQVLRSDSACPTTGRTQLFEHRSNCRVRPVNAGSA